MRLLKCKIVRISMFVLIGITIVTSLSRIGKMSVVFATVNVFLNTMFTNNITMLTK